jgi:hypothetical protein
MYDDNVVVRAIDEKENYLSILILHLGAKYHHHH